MDNKLVCSANHCVHNMNNACGAAKVQIKGGGTQTGDNTFCHTYAERSIKNYFAGMTNTNVVGGITQILSGHQVMDPQVACDATNCTYNSNYMCGAQELKINGPSATVEQQTECQTFRPKH